ncbi:MAG TPA: 4-hydroxythreonine-4-phosphate dehydrogenase, partial [Methylocella sp.]
MARTLPANIPPLGLTQGDPSGIGPELTLKAWLRTHDKPDAPPFLAVANPDRLAAIARDLDLKIPIKIVAGAEAAPVFRHALPVYALNHCV